MIFNPLIVHNILDRYVPGFLHQVRAHLGQVAQELGDLGFELSLIRSPWFLPSRTTFTPFVGGYDEHKGA